MKQQSLRIAVAQINPTVGDLQGNRDKMIAYVDRALQDGCDLIAFPELSVTGYPPEDLLLRQQFIYDQEISLRQLAKKNPDIICVTGYVDHIQGKLYNTAVVLHNGEIAAAYHKVHLPNYSVFDEERYFDSGSEPLVITVDGWRIGISICEDIWIAESVVEAEALIGKADILLNISASPYCLGKGAERLSLMQGRARRTSSAVVYVNLIGGQDELVFDGRSLVIAPDGRILQTGAAFREDYLITDWQLMDRYFFRQEKQQLKTIFHNPFPSVKVIDIAKKIEQKTPLQVQHTIQSLQQESEEVYDALLLGLKDYVHKNGFKKIVLGLSGGIDSALVAVLAVDALGKDNVISVAMPSQYSSQASIEDARKIAGNLDIQLMELSIQSVFMQYLETLAETFAGLSSEITEENLQARIRGNLLMALSNKFGWLVLVTGNKSEVSVGYCTLYGDMAGGFSPLKDVFKTMVYQLCEYRNQKAGHDLIPRRVIEKAPSAELKPDQTDQDSLPPYDLLDAILEHYIGKEMGVEEIAALGFDRETAREVVRMVDWAEYKRRQAAPGIKITRRAFGKDRRMPITNHYRAR
ncbi:NAD+ synthase [candidate division KSB1 bacterium]|nr:NAD+ synthase [candidate division KSB1 bacterium]